MTISLAKEDFIRHCRIEKNLSSKTLAAYTTDLKQFSIFLIDQAISDIHSISKVELRSFLEYLSKLKPKSIKRKIATLKAMFNYLEFEDAIAVNPFRKMRLQIKESKRLPNVMTVNEIAKLLKIAYQEKHQRTDKSSYRHYEAVRNIVVLELLFGTGARVSEIATLRIENIDLSGRIKFQGKGDKERILHICNKETLSILREYRILMLNRPNKAPSYFLHNRLGGRLSDQSIRNLVQTISRRAGFGKNVTPHMFRHTFATLLLDKDVDIKYIQSLLGHSSIVTTQIYTHVSRAKQRKILQSKHPRRHLEITSMCGHE